MRQRKSTGRTVVKAAEYVYTAVFEPAEEGGYTVTVPALPGVITEGDTFEEARSRVKEAIQGYLKTLKRHGRPIPRDPAFRRRRPIKERVAVTLKAS